MKLDQPTATEVAVEKIRFEREAEIIADALSRYFVGALLERARASLANKEE